MTLLVLIGDVACILLVIMDMLTTGDDNVCRVFVAGMQRLLQ